MFKTKEYYYSMIITYFLRPLNIVSMSLHTQDHLLEKKAWYFQYLKVDRLVPHGVKITYM